jgi:hypothetical protein
VNRKELRAQLNETLEGYFREGTIRLRSGALAAFADTAEERACEMLKFEQARNAATEYYGRALELHKALMQLEGREY